MNINIKLIEKYIKTAHPSTASVGLPTSYYSMWHIYINDIWNAVTNDTIKLFGDDTLNMHGSLWLVMGKIVMHRPMCRARKYQFRLSYTRTLKVYTGIDDKVKKLNYSKNLNRRLTKGSFMQFLINIWQLKIMTLEFSSRRQRLKEAERWLPSLKQNIGYMVESK